MFTQDDLDEAIRLHDEDGMSWNWIAKQYNMGRNVLRQYVNGERVAYIDVHPNWLHSAACVGEDPTFFDYDPSVDQRPEDAIARYELAKEVCSGCPVKAQCATAADDSDRQWTTRGGLMPIQLRRRLKGA